MASWFMKQSDPVVVLFLSIKYDAFITTAMRRGSHQYNEPISNRHLRLDVSVAVLLKMLTYAHVCCAFSSACALTSNLI
jgi:hypothetical protein